MTFILSTCQTFVSDVSTLADVGMITLTLAVELYIEETIAEPWETSD